MITNPKDGLLRRDFLRLGAAGAAALAIGGLKGGPLAAAEEAARKKIPIGLQLYSVRDDCAKDLPAVLAAVSKIGYAGVDFAGYYGRNAADLKKFLDDNNLKCCGTHTGLGSIMGDELKKTIEFHKTIGNKFLIVPSLPEEYNKSKEGWLKAAKVFNEASEKAKAEGMFVGYHNHGIEFKAVDGELPWDIFAGATKPEVVLQMDTGNCMDGGADPLAFLKKYPGRAKTVHVKESGQPEKGVIGDGKMKWKEFFEICETTGGTEWYIVEHESPGVPALEAVKLCYEALKKMGKV